MTVGILMKCWLLLLRNVWLSYVYVVDCKRLNKLLQAQKQFSIFTEKGGPSNKKILFKKKSERILKNKMELSVLITLFSFFFSSSANLQLSPSGCRWWATPKWKSARSSTGAASPPANPDPPYVGYATANRSPHRWQTHTVQHSWTSKNYCWSKSAFDIFLLTVFRGWFGQERAVSQTRIIRK